MTVKSVLYCASSKLSCADCIPAQVILCVPKEKVASHACVHNLSPELTYQTTEYSYIAADLVLACRISNSKLVASWQYTFEYDDVQLVADEVLVTDDINGVFCKGCLTEWVEQLVGEDIYITPNDDGSSTLVSQHGCEYSFSNAEFAVSNEEEFEEGIDNGANMVIVGPVTLTEDRATTTSVRVLPGGSFITDSFILTLNGPLTAGAFQIFDTSGAEVVFGSNATLYVLLEWFGAVGDGVTDDTASIQLAVNIASAVVDPLPVHALNKTYSISTIVCPSYFHLMSAGPKRSKAKFKARAAAAMFTVTGLADSWVTFEGISLDGNSLATIGISILNSDNVYIHRCGWLGVHGKGISIDGGIFIHITDGEFVGSHAGQAMIYITNFCAAVYIERMNFSSTSATYCVHADSAWTGDTVLISDCTMGSSLNTAAIRFNHSATGAARSVIRNVRIDQGAFMAHIVLDEYAYGVEITGCYCVDGTPYNILTDAQGTVISGNWLGDATVAAVGFTTSSNFCRYGTNIKAGASPAVIDTSLYQGAYHFNTIDRHIGKGPTADRTLGVLGGYGPYEWGVMFLDTTLDPDGKPIWWNGTAWVDATGAVV